MKPISNCRAPVFYLLLVLLCSFSVYAQSWKPAQGLPRNVSYRSGAREPVRVRTLEASASRIVLEYSIPAISKETVPALSYRGEAVQRLYAGNALLWDNWGEPMVPYIPVRVVIPALYDLTAVSAAGEPEAAPGPLMVAWGDGAEDMDFSSRKPDQAIYGSDKPFPEALYDCTGLQCKCGVNIAVVNLFPVQYRPLSKTVYQTNTIRLTLSLKKQAYFRGHDIRVDLGEVDPEILGLENSAALSAYLSRPPVQPLPGGLCTEGEEFSYVIITSNSLKSGSGTPYFNELIAQRKSQGFTTTIVTVEDIYAKYKGIDSPEEPRDKVRSFVRDAYNSWKTKQVLLAGNSTVIPTGKTYITAGYDSDWGGTMYVNDRYFQCVDGFYNFDKDTATSLKNWGEFNKTFRDGDNHTMPDALSELSVGRWLVSTPVQVSNMVFKTLAYENSTSPAVKKVLMVAEWLFKASQSPSPEMRYGTACMEQVKNGTTLYKGLNSLPGLTFDKLYDSDYTFPTDSFIWGFTIDELVAKLNANNATIINGLGHGTFTRLMKTAQADIPSKLTNTIPLFMVTQACYAGAGDAEMSFSFTEQSRYGLWGGVFNTFLGYAPHPNHPDEIPSLLGPSQRTHLEFWDAYLVKGKRMVGDMLSSAHDNQVNLMKDGRLIRYICHITRLQADPATRIRLTDATPVIGSQQNTYANTGGAEPASIAFCAPANIRLVVRDKGPYSLGVYTVSGKLTDMVKNRKFTTGTYVLQLDRNRFPSGVYILRLEGAVNKSIKGVLQ